MLSNFPSDTEYNRVQGDESFPIVQEMVLNYPLLTKLARTKSNGIVLTLTTNHYHQKKTQRFHILDPLKYNS